MMQAGETLSKALNRLGFYTLMYPEYPSRIRGGDNSGFFWRKICRAGGKN